MDSKTAFSQTQEFHWQILLQPGWNRIAVSDKNLTNTAHENTTSLSKRFESHCRRTSFYGMAESGQIFLPLPPSLLSWETIQAASWPTVFAKEMKPSDPLPHFKQLPWGGNHYVRHKEKKNSFSMLRFEQNLKSQILLNLLVIRFTSR